MLRARPVRIAARRKRRAFLDEQGLLRVSLSCTTPQKLPCLRDRLGGCRPSRLPQAGRGLDAKHFSGVLLSSFGSQEEVSATDLTSIITDVNMITGRQIRAARFALRLSAQELAKLCGVSLPTIQRFEQVDGIPPSRSSTLLDVKRGLEAAGIEFTGTPEEGPGIRIWAKEATSHLKASPKD
jgi:DNA-binding transcriptional regulator YiaG